MQTTNPDPKTLTDAELSAWLAEHLMGGLGKEAPSDWSPPTNIQQAMEDVVRSMCDKGYACTLYPSLLRASFGSQDMRHFGQTKAESWEQYPRAICEAAYLALVERADE